MYTIVRLESEHTYVSSFECSNSRLAMKSLRSKSRPLLQLSGRFTNACIMHGILSSALLPRIEGEVGTSRQHTNSIPLLSMIFSKSFFARSRLSSFCGKKNIPTPKSPLFPRSAPSFFASFIKKLYGICTSIPTPSPVLPSASLPARCSSFSTIVRAFSTTYRDCSPLMFTTAPIPQLSCSNLGL